MDRQLNDIEIRVLGCLIEKEHTTPDLYPLSLNSLTNACNQKSSRDPVLSLTEAEVANTLEILESKRLILAESGFGSRVIKYKHRFCNTEFSELKLSQAELAVLCVLFLRGAQTPGELRSRCARIHSFNNVAEVEAVLQEMQQGESPLIVMLPREAGRREARFAHLFGDAPIETSSASCAEVAPDQIAQLQARIAELESEVERLNLKLSHYESQ
ncbi:YceH family protein [Neptunomonas marina]|uniref:DUF480 domain-containing protein n=1 Tax=Neptunomonas marina TaxID=1815562 RepID=A0A437Q553_9GAMM|nr:YceH family protein [Neptunomonas marina]RVU29633.1 DUF480 domain-containing protein [Neptunomonas marina]